MMSLEDSLPYLPRLQDLLYTHKSFSYLGGIGLLTTLFLCRYLTSILKGEKGAIRKLGGFSIFTAWIFFTKRHDFIWENFGSDPSPHFKFNVLHVLGLLSLYHWSEADYWRSMQHNVVVLRGEEARKAYFDNKDFNLAEGFKLLRGGVRLVNASYR